MVPANKSMAPSAVRTICAVGGTPLIAAIALAASLITFLASPRIAARPAPTIASGPVSAIVPELPQKK